jgi:hypothetical protein
MERIQYPSRGWVQGEERNREERDLRRGEGIERKRE